MHHGEVKLAGVLALIRIIALILHDMRLEK
jgi:hypothetical protein